jgi:hypothetical protein
MVDIQRPFGPIIFKRGHSRQSFLKVMTLWTGLKVYVSKFMCHFHEGLCIKIQVSFTKETNMYNFFVSKIYVSKKYFEPIYQITSFMYQNFSFTYQKSCSKDFILQLFLDFRPNLTFLEF